MGKIPVAIAMLLLMPSALYAADAAPAAAPPAKVEVDIKSDSTETVSRQPEPEATLDAFVTKFRGELRELEAQDPGLRDTPIYHLITQGIPKMELACTLARYQAAHSGPTAIPTLRANMHCDQATDMVAQALGTLLGSDRKTEDSVIFAPTGALCIDDERPGCLPLAEPEMPSYQYGGFRIRLENRTGYFGEPSCDYQGHCRGR